MSFENVNLWYAKDKNDKIVVINEVDKNTKDKYYCPLCGSEVIPRQGSEKAWCFAHIDKSECSSESMYHFWCKYELLKVGDKFIIKSDEEKQYICKEILVEKTYEVDGKEYRPDLTVITEDSKTIYFEMEYTNEKRIEDYIDIWIGLGNSVVQVDVKTLINSKSAELPMFKALWYEGKCFNVKKGEDSIYHETIGKYKEKYCKDINEKKKADIERLDWLWRDIKKYKIDEVDIEHISNLIQSIEDESSKNIVVEVLRKSSCNHIIKDYIEFNNIKILEYLESINFEKECIKNEIKPVICVSKPYKIYDRIFNNGIKISLHTFKNNICFYEIVTYNILDIKNISTKATEEVMFMDDLLEWAKHKLNRYNSKIINIFNKPNVNYCKVTNGEYRLYLNNFKNVIGDDYITYEKYKTFENATKYILNALAYDKLFTIDEIKKLEDISNQILELFETQDIKFKFHIFDGIKFKIKIKYLNEDYYICETTKEEFEKYNVDYIKNRIIAIINKDYDITLNHVKNRKIYNNINNVVMNLNNKYKKHVNGRWHIEYEEFQNKYAIWNNSPTWLWSKNILDFINDKISLQDFETLFADEVSDYIRKQKYGSV